MIKELREFFFQKHLQSQVHKTNPKLQLLEFKDVKEIAIAYDATEISTIYAIKDFEHKVRQEGKRLSTFAYINTNDKKTDLNIITNKDLDWRGFPTKKNLFDFANKEYDVLLGIFNDLNSPLNAIFASSKAKMRIGVDYQQNRDLYDIILNSSKSLSSKDILNHLIEFLSTVKTR